MYPEALDAGISPHDFWDMSIPEVADMINSFRRRQRQQQKEDIGTAYQLIAMLSLAFDGKLKPLYEMYPDLYAEELKAEAEPTADVADSRRRWAAAMAKRFNDNES